MKDLLSKEHYCYKIHTLLMKSSAYPPPIPPSMGTPSIWTTPSIFKYLDPPLLWFFRNFNPTLYKFTLVDFELIFKLINTLFLQYFLFYFL